MINSRKAGINYSVEPADVSDDSKKIIIKKKTLKRSEQC